MTLKERHDLEAFCTQEQRTMSDLMRRALIVYMSHQKLMPPREPLLRARAPTGKPEV